MTPSTNGNILGRDQLDWASLLYVDQVWYDGNDPAGVPLRSFVNPNDQPMFVFLQAEFINGYSRIYSNNFNIRYRSNVPPVLEAGTVGSNLVATVYAYLFPGESFCLVAEREQQVPVNYTASVSQRTIDPVPYEGSVGAGVTQTGVSTSKVSLPRVSRYHQLVGGFSRGDCIGISRVQGMPSGIVFTRSPDGQIGTLSNDGEDMWMAHISAYIGGYTGGIRRTGDADSFDVVVDNYTRIDGYYNLAPGESVSLEINYGGTYNVYGSITFVPISWLDRFDGTPA